MFATWRDIERRLGGLLRERGALGALLIDLGSLGRIERRYGRQPFRRLREQVDAALAEIAEAEDEVARVEPEGDELLVVRPAPSPDERFSIARLAERAHRVREALLPRVRQLTLVYEREELGLEVGYAMALHNPLLSEQRQLLRLIAEAREAAGLGRRVRERGERAALVDVIQGRDVWIGFQPILDLDDESIVGHEALARGPRATPLEAPGRLFALAAKYGLAEELERCCRRRTFLDWDHYGAPGRLFVNTIPATVSDASFLGPGVIEFLGSRIAPADVTLEITEREVIGNLGLYREAMQAFIELGFSFAIDDVGAGYSGLETIANLGASYLKIDLSLVRDVHRKPSSQAIVKAIRDLGAEMGATVIAEGIETRQEADAVREMGIRWGQGYLYALPVDPHADPTAVATPRG